MGVVMQQSILLSTIVTCVGILLLNVGGLGTTFYLWFLKSLFFMLRCILVVFKVYYSIKYFIFPKSKPVYDEEGNEVQGNA